MSLLGIDVSVHYFEVRRMGFPDNIFIRSYASRATGSLNFPGLEGIVGTM